MTKDPQSDPFAQRDAARRLTRAAMRTGLPPTSSDPTPRQKPQRSTPTLWIAGSVLLLAALASAALVMSPASGPPPAAPPLPVASADEAGILAAPQDQLERFRLTAAPAVLVLAFPSLHEQALALDRIGAFVEKAGMPHDRVLTSTDLATRIAAAGEDFDTFYYGHDYRAEDLRRFFTTAAAQHLGLDAEEQDLKTFLQQQGMLKPNATGAVISLPPESLHPPVDSASRATILRHEVSHGVYFTNPAYAAYTQQFWSTTLTDAERAAFRKMLGAEGYDTTNDDLIRNETQAYLVHTTDKRFFNPATLGIDTTTLRARFIENMPASWLKDETK